MCQGTGCQRRWLLPCKICFASQRHQAKDPAKILVAFNAMLGEVLAGQYVTAACAVINLSTKTVTYAGAGHPPALLLRNNGGDVIELAENGLFIGPFPHATYTNVSASFESGDRLLLYTDGIVEAAASDGEPFGRERLTKFLLETQDFEPAEFIQQLFAKISSGIQEDDLTVVLAEAQ
jgi:phosphoserine phosphatase RsbU/P